MIIDREDAFESLGYSRELPPKPKQPTSLAKSRRRGPNLPATSVPDQASATFERPAAALRTTAKLGLQAVRATEDEVASRLAAEQAGRPVIPPLREGDPVPEIAPVPNYNAYVAEQHRAGVGGAEYDPSADIPLRSAQR